MEVFIRGLYSASTARMAVISRVAVRRFVMIRFMKCVLVIETITDKNDWQIDSPSNEVANRLSEVALLRQYSAAAIQPPGKLFSKQCLRLLRNPDGADVAGRQ